MFWKIAFFLVTSIETTLSSNINQARLSDLQSKYLYNLFSENKLRLVFDFNQQKHTTGTLFELKHAHRVVLSLLSERNILKTKFTFQMGSILNHIDLVDVDDDFHRLSFEILNGRFQLLFDCIQQGSGTYGLKFVSSSHKKSTVNVGFGLHYDQAFPGQIREFSADIADSFNFSCAEPQIASHTHLYQSTLLAQADQEDDRQIEAHGNEQTVKSREDSNTFSTNLFDQRLDFVEHQFQNIRESLTTINNRLKLVELHQRGCLLNRRRIMSFGEKRQNLKECIECQCSVSGQLHCGPIGCSHLKCAHPVQAHGECCPHCGKQCYYNGQHYEHGMSMWPKQCVRCHCNNGHMECKFHRPEHCPQLTCEHQETPPNQCCPVCTNFNHCSPTMNSCHSNAVCENRQFGAQCTCKQGFFGNGTACYDIDECLEENDASQQAKRCQAGTVCINLPGAFKCDCLPGFQRLDAFNCLDAIRV